MSDDMNDLPELIGLVGDGYGRWALWNREDNAGEDAVQFIRHDIYAALIEALEAANRGLVRLNEATEARAVTAEAALDTWKRISGGMEGMAETYSAALAAERETVARLVEALGEIDRIYYMEATNPDPGYIRKMAARMRAAARDALASVDGANLTGEKP